MAYATSIEKQRTLIEAKSFFKLHFVNHCTSYKRQYTHQHGQVTVFKCKWIRHKINCTYNILQVRTCIMFCVCLCLNNKQKWGMYFKFPSPPKMRIVLTSGFNELFSDDFVDSKMCVNPSCFLTTMSLYRYALSVCLTLKRSLLSKGWSLLSSINFRLLAVTPVTDVWMLVVPLAANASIKVGVPGNSLNKYNCIPLAHPSQKPY